MQHDVREFIVSARAGMEKLIERAQPKLARYLKDRFPR